MKVTTVATFTCICVRSGVSWATVSVSVEFEYDRVRCGLSFPVLAVILLCA